MSRPAPTLEAWTRAIDQIGVALRPMVDAMNQVARKISNLFIPLRAIPPALLPHVIVPNYDLACSVCGLGPEEHG